MIQVQCVTDILLISAKQKIVSSFFCSSSSMKLGPDASRPIRCTAGLAVMDEPQFIASNHCTQEVHYTKLKPFAQGGKNI